MDHRLASRDDQDVRPLLDLIERRFALSLTGPAAHLCEVQQHYREKRAFLLAQHGEAGALAREDYAKAVLISEASRLLLLREIMPRPRKKSKQSRKTP